MIMEDSLSKDNLKSFEKAVYNGQGKAFTLLENFTTLFPENEKLKVPSDLIKRKYLFECKEIFEKFLFDPSPYFHAPCHNHYYNDLLNVLNFETEELQEILSKSISLNGVKIIMFTLVLKANSNDLEAVTVINKYLQDGVYFNEILPQVCNEATFNLDENIICERLIQEDAVLETALNNPVNATLNKTLNDASDTLKSVQLNEDNYYSNEKGKNFSVLKFDDNSNAAKYFLNKESEVCLTWARKFINCSSERKNLAEGLIIEHGTLKDLKILHNLLQKFTLNENWENVSDILTKFESLNETLPDALLLTFWHESPYFYVRLKAFQLMNSSFKKQVASEGVNDADMLVREECTQFLKEIS